MKGYLERLLNSVSKPWLGRVAVVISRGVRGYLDEEVRRSIPTYIVSSLTELRQALIQAEKVDEVLLALDIRELPADDTRLFCNNLSLTCTSQRGFVYLVTPEQFSLFAGGLFGFIFRE